MLELQNYNTVFIKVFIKVLINHKSFNLSSVKINVYTRSFFITMYRKFINNMQTEQKDQTATMSRTTQRSELYF